MDKDILAGVLFIIEQGRKGEEKDRCQISIINT